MALIGSPHPTSESYGPRVVGALSVLVVMSGATVVALAGLVVGTGGDRDAGLTYQLGLWWTLLATIGAVAGTVIRWKRYAGTRGPWRAALRSALVSTGWALLADAVGVGLLLAIHQVTGA